MEKDKLMELINNIVDERKKIKNEIVKQDENNVLNGLLLMKKCLEYANEMKCYFDKINSNSFVIDICHRVKFLYGNGKQFCFVENGFSYSCAYLEDMQNFENFIKKLDDDRCIIAKKLIENNYNFTKFKNELHNILAKEIVNYEEENKILKNKLI